MSGYTEKKELDFSQWYAAKEQEAAQFEAREMLAACKKTLRDEGNKALGVAQRS